MLFGEVVNQLEGAPNLRALLQRNQEEAVQAKLSAQASAAVSQPSRISFKDIEVSRGCDLLYR